MEKAALAILKIVPSFAPLMVLKSDAMDRELVLSSILKYYKILRKTQLQAVAATLLKISKKFKFFEKNLMFLVLGW